MAKKTHNAGVDENAGMGITLAKLRGRQSVRTTFRLPEALIELLAVAAAQFGLKQKSLFDQLVEDGEVLGEVAEGAAAYRSENGDRRQKTYVISKQSLLTLERVAAERNISRDILVEISISRLLPVLCDEREKHWKRVKICREIESYLESGRKILAQAEELLDKGDPVCEEVAGMVRLGEAAVANLKDIITKGKGIEDFQVERYVKDMEPEGRYEIT